MVHGNLGRFRGCGGQYAITGPKSKERFVAKTNIQFIILYYNNIFISNSILKRHIDIDMS